MEKKCPLVMSTHTGLHRNPQDHDEGLKHSLWSSQPHLTTEDLRIPTSSPVCGYQAGSISKLPAKQASPSQLRNITDIVVKTVISEDAKDKENEWLRRAGGTQASLCIRRQL